MYYIIVLFYKFIIILLIYFLNISIEYLWLFEKKPNKIKIMIICVT